jgi:hypothetical protein
MNRVLLLTSILVFTDFAPAAEVAPPPREVGQEALDPAQRVERIIRTAQDVGDRLAQLDPGRDTRNRQGDILHDIDALIRQQDQPPMPMGSPPMSDPMGKKGSNPPSQSDPRSSPGLPQDSSNRPPQRVQRNRPQPQPQPGGKGREPMPEPMASQEPKEKATKPMPGGTAKGGEEQGGPVPPKPLMPLVGDVEKDVWGHLPEQLRQQVSNYYRQQFMPQYSELLRQYYSSLAERESNPAKR